MCRIILMVAILSVWVTQAYASQEGFVKKALQVLKQSYYQEKVDVCAPAMGEMATAAYQRHEEQYSADRPIGEPKAQALQECLGDNYAFGLTPSENEIRTDTMIAHTEVREVDGVFVVELDGFGRQAAFQLGDALKEIGNVPLVLDIRNNLGGFVTEYHRVLYDFSKDLDHPLYGQWTSRGTETYTAGKTQFYCPVFGGKTLPDGNCKHSNHQTHELVEPGGLRHVHSFVVLTNERTASVAELLVLWLRLNIPNVQVIGEPTYGKWQIMTPFHYKDPSGGEFILVFTTGESFVLDPHGEKHSVKNGVQPDILVEEEDRQLEVAIAHAKKLRESTIAHRGP